VLVRVRATSLNYRDLLTAEGRYNRAPNKPGLVPLSDGAGEVEAVGAEVTTVKVGDRVAGNFFQAWHGGPWKGDYVPSAMGGGIDGMLSEKVILQEHSTVPLPSGWSFEEGATLPCAALTAWNSVVTHGGLTKGETLLVQGTGGVSIFALQLARALGAEVIATTSSAAKASRLQAMGVKAVINYKDEPEWEKAVLGLTGKKGVELVCEVGGAGTLEKSIRALAHGGRVMLVGVLAGGVSAGNPFGLAMKNATLRGIYVGSTAEFLVMNRFLEQHALRPVIDKVFPFGEAPEAFRYLKSGAHFGKVVVAV
jgi:NADPH:quinone reductase-like Zn-dependent oxidoreductase